MNAHRAVNIALALGAITIAVVVWNDYLIERDISVHNHAYALGFNTGTASMSEKAVTERMCMAFWFGNDSQRVGKAIQKIKG